MSKTIYHRVLYFQSISSSKHQKFLTNSFSFKIFETDLIYIKKNPKIIGWETSPHQETAVRGTERHS